MPAMLAMLAIMTLALLIAMPTWRYLVRDDKEQELIFRGRQISEAIARFQRKNGNALPASIEQLVQGKFLRKAFEDPMAQDGKWRIVRPGELGPVRPGGGPGGSSRANPTPTATPIPTSSFGAASGGQSGPVAGVASLSTELGLRRVNGSQNYNRWVFAPSVPFVLTGQAAVGVPRGQRLRLPDLEAPRLSR